MVIGARAQPLRLFCAARDQTTVALAQLPGHSSDVGGNIIVRTGTATSVPGWIAHFAGPSAAGGHPAATIRVADLRARRQAVGLDYGEVSTNDRVRRLLSEPRSGYGHIEVEENRRGTDGPARYYLSWSDVEGDGRYLYRYRRDDLTIEPADAQRFSRALTRVLGLEASA